ncbi:OmpW family protein [Delftia tsuruhatensis]|uniref:OmpW/AlkL family protein n=1 Tax=Delftia tsuruhatensis TaxID=180282 RepID=UPI0024442DCC|nr:OmpW family protein [Delftia tsuruhatensis]MDH0774077.1 OmpW family protein [Delftia tsuruhatensis]MDH1458222.1 OmpW family protein [Delftia tsuruhatensis]MDH1823626.1 OmpW family protein [Delftia tsuruhatensis]WGG12985.1 OmpW family protein [Delftia tsuruhatensis]
MKRTLLAVAAVCALSSGAAFAQQAEGPWMVRVRAVHLDSVNKDSTGLGLSINDKWMPELDVSYFFTPNIAAELVLTYPQKHDLRANGLGQIGSLKHLPPTLLAQYHFTNLGAFKPYVGAGVNFTRFSSVNFDPAVQAALNPSIKKNSFGGALQIGFDYALDKNWSLNFDVKKVFIETDVRAGGTKVGTFKVNPVLVGVGLGYRF